MQNKIKGFVSNKLFCFPYLQTSLIWFISRIQMILTMFMRYKVASDPSKKFVLIMGSGRSGNTLLRRLLMEGANIYFPPESYVLGAVSISAIMNPRLSWREQVDLIVSAFEYQQEFDKFPVESLRQFAIRAKKWPLNNKRDVGKLVVELYRYLGEASGQKTEWVGDKTPLNILNIGLINWLFPMGNFIYIKRDGVDVVNSYVKSGLYGNYEEAAERWISSGKIWRRFRRKLKSKRFIEISYEELVESPSEIVNKISIQFGFPKRNIELNISQDMGDVNALRHHEKVMNKVDMSSIGKGRKVVTINDLGGIYKKFNEELLANDYEPI